MSRKAEHPLIIERPDLQTLRQRYGYATLTLLFWVAWFYLWLPLASLAMWALGAERFYEHMVVLEGYRSFLEHLRLYQAVIAAIATFYLGWALSNQIRFRGLERRRRPPAVSPAEMASFFGVTEAQVAALRTARRAVIHHRPDGTIEGLEIDPELQDPREPVLGRPIRALPDREPPPSAAGGARVA